MVAVFANPRRARHCVGDLQLVGYASVIPATAECRTESPIASIFTDADGLPHMFNRDLVTTDFAVPDERQRWDARVVPLVGGQGLRIGGWV